MQRYTEKLEISTSKCVCVWKGRAGWGWGWGPGELIDPPFGAFQGANVFDHSLLTDPTPGTT